MKNQKLNVGDRVAYSAKFLRSICDYSHESASKRGTVTSLKDYGTMTHVKIDWDDDKDELRSGAAASNLVRVQNISAEAAI